MLKRIVPTWPKNVPVATGGLAVASIVKTSLSGSAKRTAFDQSRPIVSCHCPDGSSNLTMRPVSGCVVPWKFVFGDGSPPGIVEPPTVHGDADAPPSQTSCSLIDVVWLPEWNAAA